MKVEEKVLHIIPEQPRLQLLQSECQICYLEFDERSHYPMLICSAQHIICHSCFLELTKFKRYIECPFCKRNTQTEHAQKFRYFLIANAKYRQLRTKYYQVLGCLQSIGKNPQQDKDLLSLYFQEHKSLLVDQQQSIQELKKRIKQSQDQNRFLRQQIEVQRQKYTVFELQINQCKYNDLIMRNRVTMVEYQYNQLLKENKKLSGRYEELKQDLYIETKRLQGFAQKNEELIRENMILREDNYQKGLEDEMVMVKKEKSTHSINNKDPLIKYNQNRKYSLQKEQIKASSNIKKEKNPDFQQKIGEDQKTEKSVKSLIKKTIKKMMKK